MGGWRRETAGYRWRLRLRRSGLLVCSKDRGKTDISNRIWVESLKAKQEATELVCP